MDKNFFKSFRLVPKPKPEMKDPPRFPKLTNPLEETIKSDFKLQMDKALVDVTKKMIDVTKNL